VMFLKRL